LDEHVSDEDMAKAKSGECPNCGKDMRLLHDMRYQIPEPWDLPFVMKIWGCDSCAAVIWQQLSLEEVSIEEG
jgi:uncharacterized protein with PIN domain